MLNAGKNNLSSQEDIVFLYCLWTKIGLYSQTNYFAITKCLFRHVQLTYSEYGIGSDVCLYFPLPNGSGFAKNVTIWGW